MRQGQNQHHFIKNNTKESVQAAASTFNQKRHVYTPELQLTECRLPQQNFYQFPRFSGSNHLKHLLGTKNLTTHIVTLQKKQTKPLKKHENIPDKLKLTCHHCKKPGLFRNQCRQLKAKKQKEWAGNTQTNLKTEQKRQ